MLNGLKQTIKIVAQRTVLSPPSVRYCSQTIYEALLGCLRMWEATSEAKWQKRAQHLVDILIFIQRPDGGFDIGYDFNFGLLHKKGQSTSPELVGLMALCEYARLFGGGNVEKSATSAAEWIREHVLDMGDGKYAIPYSPYSTNEVMVYNGTSFACGALGCYLGQFGGDEELNSIYSGMVEYLECVLSRDVNLPGCFWYYCDQLRDDLDEIQRSKIDYYHQMQQVELHALAQQVSPVQLQHRIIREAADHIAALHERHPVIPYTNNPRLFKNQVHLWGFSSVVSGMLEAAAIIPEQKDVYRKVASDVLAKVIKHAWNGEYFEPVLAMNGSRVGSQLYMVRSDAWVFNALASAMKHFGDGYWQEIAEKCYHKMASVNFSGPESHASNLRIRSLGALLNKIKGIIEF